MRIAVVTDLARRAGGAESYLAAIVPALRARGHEVAFAYEADEPADRAPVVDADVPTVDVGALGIGGALMRLRQWGAEVAYVHGVRSFAFNEALVAALPSVYFAHSHAGMCISGAKAWTSPVATACARQFGAACVAHYFPHRCGGLSPVTLARAYRRETRRRDGFARYAAIVVGSPYMRDEVRRYVPAGLPVQVAPLFVREVAPPRAAAPADRWTVVFAGRLDRQKGASVLLEAARLAAPALDRPLELHVAGAGEELPALEARRAAVEAAGVRVQLHGWLDRAALDALFDRAHLFALPSLAPESFGLAGLEAAARGVPVVAFGHGGVTAWLQDGLDGHLAARADAPALAAAIARALATPEHQARLAAGARAVAAAHTIDRHLDVLERSLLDAAGPVASPLAGAALLHAT